MKELNLTFHIADPTKGDNDIINWAGRAPHNTCVMEEVELRNFLTAENLTARQKASYNARCYL